MCKQTIVGAVLSIFLLCFPFSSTSNFQGAVFPPFNTAYTILLLKDFVKQKRGKFSAGNKKEVDFFITTSLDFTSYFLNVASSELANRLSRLILRVQELQGSL